MDNQQVQDQAAAQPVTLVAKIKEALGEGSFRQVSKLTLLALALIAWYPVYPRLDPFSRWLAYDLCRIAPGSHLGESVAFSSWMSPKSSCCCS